MAQIGFLVIAAGLLYAGIQGLRGQPDRTGKQTSKAVAIVCLVLAVAAVVFALVILPRM